MTANIDPTPHVVGGIALAAIAGGLVLALGKLLERLADRRRARAAAVPPLVPPAPPTPPAPRVRDGVPTRAATDAQTTAYHRTERP